MSFFLPTHVNKVRRKIRFFFFTLESSYDLHPTSTISRLKTLWAFSTSTLAFVCLLIIVIFSNPAVQQTISPLVASLHSLHPLKDGKKGYQVYGFAPYWTFDKLDNVDFSVLTTLAYFGVPVDSGGNLVKDDPGYSTFVSDKATTIFKKAHDAGTKVNLTVTQMDNFEILSLLDNPDAQKNAIEQIVAEVKNRGIDGVNVDFEFTGTPGSDYRNKFNEFIANLSTRLHSQIPQGEVSVAVYALSAKDPHLYDIASLSKSADQIFMMAYDFASAGADNAEPTSPLYGHKQGKYSYDIATAVEDFLKYMPANKLILGVPYYGYNYLVYNPQVKSETRPYWSWRGTPTVQTYSTAQENVTPGMKGIDSYKTGWDNDGQVGWRAYHVADTDTWRMIFVEDQRSLGIKYDFAKGKNLAGVGIWALGFDDGRQELWVLLRDKFGVKLADSRGLLYK